MYIITSAPQTENPKYRDVQPHCHKVYQGENPVAVTHAYGEKGLAEMNKFAQAANEFISRPLVGLIRLHPSGKVAQVREMSDGSFAHLYHSGEVWGFAPVDAGEVLHFLIEKAGWPQQQSEFAGISGFQQSGNGTFQGGGANDPRGYEFDYRAGPDGKIFCLHTCRTYKDVTNIADASVEIRKYFNF